MKFDAPGGPKMMDPKNQHTWKPVYIGEILKDGQFKIIYKSQGSGCSGLVQPLSASGSLRRFQAPPVGRRSRFDPWGRD